MKAFLLGQTITLTGSAAPTCAVGTGGGFTITMSAAPAAGKAACVSFWIEN